MSPNLALLCSLAVVPGLALCGCPDAALDEPADELPPAETPDTDGEVAEETVKPAAERTALLGTWRSEACGERGYAREMVFIEGGSYVGFDLISPCPPDVACVWSGIVTFRGAWTVAGETVTLAEEGVIGSAGAMGSPPPDTFAWPENGDPIRSRGGEVTCVYERAEARDAAPYLESRVTPRS
jgi:hypothetical protein